MNRNTEPLFHALLVNSCSFIFVKISSPFCLIHCHFMAKLLNGISVVIFFSQFPFSYFHCFFFFALDTWSHSQMETIRNRYYENECKTEWYLLVHPISMCVCIRFCNGWIYSRLFEYAHTKEIEHWEFGSISPNKLLCKSSIPERKGYSW